MQRFLHPFSRLRSLGAALVEYIVLMALIAVVLLGAVLSFGSDVRDLYAVDIPVGSTTVDGDGGPVPVVATVALAPTARFQTRVDEPFTFDFKTLATLTGESAPGVPWVSSDLTWTLPAEQLPDGLTVDPASGVLSGTVESAYTGPGSFTLVATHAGANGQQIYEIEVANRRLFAVDIESHSTYSCLIDQTGAVWCWGLNAAPFGNRLGLGAVTSTNVPLKLPGLDNMMEIHLKGSWACGLRDDGAAFCWGRNPYGMGNDTNSSSVPVRVIDNAGLRDVTGENLVLTNSTACLYPGGMSGGDYWCWGSNVGGVFGDNTQSFSPRRMARLLNGLNLGSLSGVGDDHRIAGGGGHFCGIGGLGGEVICWGWGQFHVLGTGSENNQFTPTAVTSVAFDGVAKGVWADGGATCAAFEDGTASCWGDNGAGQAGLGHRNGITVPTKIPGLSNVDTMAVGYNAACAILTNGETWCWGDEAADIFGWDNSVDTTVPQLVTVFPSTPTDLNIGQQVICALFDQGAPMCVGSNFAGSLGDGTNNDSETFVDVTWEEEDTVNDPLPPSFSRR
jgi:alpha-tubulin suppressor-like RCC1 family protein/Flp pilus assembly pilin Flp